MNFPDKRTCKIVSRPIPEIGSVRSVHSVTPPNGYEAPSVAGPGAHGGPARWPNASPEKLRAIHQIKQTFGATVTDAALPHPEAPTS